ncbi:Membrane protein [Streptomyces venezuelae]|nr:Membrane protein [Streptomyces venezuelae]
MLVLAPTAGGAYANDGVKATVTPSTASPGADIDVRVQGCKGTTGAAKSQAFVADVELTGRDGGGAPLFGDTTIKSGLQDGTYKVTVTCDGHDHGDVGTVQVKHHQPTHRPTHEPTHHATPVAPVRAGGGGTAAFAAPAAPGVAQTTTGSGLGTPYTLLGLGMAALAAVAVAFRSSRRAAASGTDAGTGTGSSTGSD